MLATVVLNVPLPIWIAAAFTLWGETKLACLYLFTCIYLDVSEQFILIGGIRP